MYQFFTFHGLAGWFKSALSTITFPEFHRFVLVVNVYYRIVFGNRSRQSASNPVDRTLLSLSGMKLIVKGWILHSDFRDVMEKTFPMMASAGMLEFEPND